MSSTWAHLPAYLHSINLGLARIDVGFRTWWLSQLETHPIYLPAHGLRMTIILLPLINSQILTCQRQPTKARLVSQLNHSRAGKSTSIGD